MRIARLLTKRDLHIYRKLASNKASPRVATNAETAEVGTGTNLSVLLTDREFAER